MRPLTHLLISLLMTTALQGLYAQEKAFLSVFANFCMPAGDFGNDLGRNPRVTRRDGFDVGDDAGFATNSLGAGLEFAVPVGIEGVSWISSASLLLNGSDEASLNSTFRSLLGDSVNVEFDYGRWLQVPVLTGFRFSVPLLKPLDFYASIQGGLSLLKPPDRKATVSGEVVDKRTFDMGRQFGYGLGGGIVISDRLDLGVRYLDFGEPEFDGTRLLARDFFTSSFDIIGEDVILGQKMPVSVLVFNVGYRF